MQCTAAQAVQTLAYPANCSLHRPWRLPDLKARNIHGAQLGRYMASSCRASLVGRSIEPQDLPFRPQPLTPQHRVHQH